MMEQKKKEHDHIQDTAWFETLYKECNEDTTKIPWAKLKPNDALIYYLNNNGENKGKALVIGCGLGDDAKALHDAGYDTLAIDISKSALEWAQKRFNDTSISFEEHSILQMPEHYQNHFDLVFEALTIQSLPVKYRNEMIEAISQTLTPGGKLLVVAHGKKKDERFDGPPWPLYEEELKAFSEYGLKELSFETFEEPSPIASMRFIALFEMPKA